MSDTIHLVDLTAQYNSIESDLQSAIQGVLHSTNFILGSDVSLFEQEFSSFCNAKYAVGVASGTGALHLALRAIGVGPGDEVITVSHTFIATAEAIVHCGAHPIFVDVDPVYFTLDPAKLEVAITPRTRAIIPVHLYGQCADMGRILAIASKHNIPIIEDAAQAHGATYNGKTSGTIGKAGCFSFYPGKNLGAFGDAGAIITDDEDFADRVRRMRNHGRTKKYVHLEVGYGERLDTLQAAVLRVKLANLENWNKKRRYYAKCYTQLLEDLDDVITPKIRPNCDHVFHLYVIQTPNRDLLSEHFKKQGIQAGIHYPVPLHLQPAFKHLNYKKGELPVTEKFAKTILSLPIYPELGNENVNRIVNAIRSFYS